MAGFSKWIGGGLGWAFGGPIGGILGFVFGAMVDGMNQGTYEYKPTAGKPTQEGDFSISLLILAASVMRADGKVLRSELNFVKDVLKQQFGEAKAEQLIRMLREILKQEYSLRQVCLQIRSNMQHSARLQLMHFLFGISLADKQLHPEEQVMIRLIAGYLYVSENDLNSIQAMYVVSDESDYKILEISSDSSDEEIRKAYRKMAMKYHPDKVNHLGEDVQRAAEQKFQSLQQAYERIKKSRNIT